MRRLRVLTISKPYVSRSYRDKIALWAKDPGLEVGLIAPFSWAGQMFEPEPVGEQRNYWLRQLPICFNGHNHFHFYRGLDAAIAAFAPDILNVEEEHYSIVTLQAFRIAARRNIRSIFYTWQNIDKRYPLPFAMIEQYIFRHAAAAVAGNQEAAEILLRKGYQGRIEVIPQMGVSAERFLPVDSDDNGRVQAKIKVGLAPDRFWLVFPGRVVEEKGLDDLLAAVSEGTPDRVAVAIIGGGPYLETLRQRFGKLAGQGRLVFRPPVASTEVADCLRAADVMCLPSRTERNWKEQFGRILVEAMVAEAVVLGSSSGEIPNVIGDAGVIFQERNVGDLRQKINELAESPQRCRRLRDAGRERAIKNFTNEVIAKKFQDLFYASALPDVSGNVFESE